MKKVLVVGDGGCYTGFARVLHSIIKFFPEDYEFHHIAVNYRGDPFPIENPRHILYPAMLGGDLMGINRFPTLYNKIKPDLVFILNDLWILNYFVSHFEKDILNKTIVYFPVDAFGTDFDWLDKFEQLGGIVTYTEFAKNEVLNLKPELKVQVIPHGIDTSKFYPLDKKSSREALRVIQPDDFIVFNGNRNQPRKRIDLTFQAFAKFALNKPKNVRLYAHMGLVDSGWDLQKLAVRYGISDRIIVTSSDLSPQAGVPDERLNIIYNACDVGINTSMGEGWGLMNTEQAAVGVAQIVPDSSACAELFNDCGYLIPIKDYYTYTGQMTIGAVVDVDKTVAILESAYTDREQLAVKNQLCGAKFTRPEYRWENISKQWLNLFEKVADDYRMAYSGSQPNNQRHSQFDWKVANN